MAATVCRAVTGAGIGFTTATGQRAPVSPIATSRGRHAPRPSKLIRSNLFQRKLGVVIITNRIRISNILSTRNLIFSAQRKRTKKKLYPTISYPKKASPIVHRRTISKLVSFSSCKKSRKHIC